MDSISVASESVAAATALAGLILVYLGSLATGFDSFEPQERRSVKSRYQMRAWLAFVGLLLALASALLGVLGKWLPNECVADISVVVLLVAFVWGAGIAFMTAKEIN